MFTFYEFFAGGGMARAGLGSDFRCLFANDFDKVKAETYWNNWDRERKHLTHGDIAALSLEDLEGWADLAWASFPCQDLSLAGDYRGLGRQGAKAHTRSGTFWHFWRLMQGLADQGRAPSVIVLENVYGTLRSRNGKDFAAIASALSGGGYRFGAVVADAKWFLPQSRPRVFIIAVRKGGLTPVGCGEGPDDFWHPPALREAIAGSSSEARRDWLWWSPRRPPTRNIRLIDVIEKRPTGVDWHTPAETAYLLSLMSAANREKLEAAKRQRGRVVGTVYRRTRLDEDGNKVQRAEARFDDIAGCLRTPAGGSSRQTILVIERGEVRSRLLSPREAAALMGLPKDFELPVKYNDAYKLAGDGVAVPVVRHLAQEIILPTLRSDFREPAVSMAAE